MNINKEIHKRFQIKIQAKQYELKNAPFWKRGKIKKEIQALEEGQRDILTPSVTQAATTDSVVDENNYTSYAKQVETTYEMYNARSKYGSELLGALVDTRVALIGGEGLSVKVEGSAEAKRFVEDFLNKNKLHGTRLLQQIQIGEMEGRNLLVMKPDQKKKYIKLRSVSWKNKAYTVHVDDFDVDIVTKITVKDKISGEEKPLASTNISVYIRIGGSIDRINETTNRIHRVLTQVENFSRSTFDLRKNSHLFGKTMPFWETETTQQAKSINNDVEAGDWQIGQGYAGPAKFSFVEPSGSAADVIIKDLLTSLKTIATMTGIPIHWLSWPELMSNRATAENIHESLILSTKKERLIWEESYKEAIEKAQILAVEKLNYPQSILAPVTVKLPIISIAQLKQIAEIWTPLWQMELVDKFTIQNMLPGINPYEVNKALKKEKEEAAKNSVMNNQTLDKTIEDMKDE